jgi:hypothetical protein
VALGVGERSGEAVALKTALALGVALGVVFRVALGVVCPQPATRTARTSPKTKVLFGRDIALPLWLAKFPHSRIRGRTFLRKRFASSSHQF